MSKDEALEIFLNGRIDKGNVEEIVESIQEMLKENPHSKLCVDFSDVSEVTEDGLDSLKEFGKKVNNVELTNLTDDIYEVFKKFGIDSVMPISKKMKIEV